MKKIISAVLVLTFLFACAMTSYAADLTSSCSLVGKVSKVEDGKFTLSFYLVEDGNANSEIDVPVDSINWAIGLKFDNNALSLVELPTLGYGATSGTNSTKLNAVTDSYYLEIETAAETTLTLTDKEPIASFKFALKDGVTSVEDFSLSAFEISDTDFNSVGLDYSTPYSIDKVVIGGSTPEKPTTAEIDAATVTKGTTAVGNDGTEYTDVPTYIGKVTINNIGSKKVVLTPVATLNGVAHTLKSAPTITFDNTTLEEGKVEFKFALIGAPTSGVELTAKVDIVD